MNFKWKYIGNIIKICYIYIRCNDLKFQCNFQLKEHIIYYEVESFEVKILILITIWITSNVDNFCSISKKSFLPLTQYIFRLIYSFSYSFSFHALICMFLLYFDFFQYKFSFSTHNHFFLFYFCCER